MLIHREGFKVAVDGVTPDMLGFLNLAAFEADYIKINVSAERAGQLTAEPVKQALQSIAKEKLIFFRCDNEPSLNAGLDLGVTHFQGWLIDDAVQQGRGAS